MRWIHSDKGKKSHVSIDASQTLDKAPGEEMICINSIALVDDNNDIWEQWHQKFEYIYITMNAICISFLTKIHRNPKMNI